MNNPILSQLRIILCVLTLLSPSCGSAPIEEKGAAEREILERKHLKNTGFACLSTASGGVSINETVTARVALDTCPACSTSFAAGKCSISLWANQLVLSGETTRTTFKPGPREVCTLMCRPYLVTCTGPALTNGTYEIVYGEETTTFSVPSTKPATIPRQANSKCDWLGAE